MQEKHNAESLPEIFGLQAALFVAQHGKQLDADLQNAVIGSTLEWAKPQEQTAIFANLITQSAVYMAAVRCGLGDSAVPQDAFADIDRFDTESAVLALGNAVNRAGRQMFAEIGAVVKSIDSVAKTQPKQYDENVSKTNQQEVQDHGYDESERVSGAQDGNEGNAQTAGRENRSAAGEVPAREPLPAVRQDAAGRDAVQRPETDRAALLGAGGADHHEAAGQQPGTGQEQRPIGLDGAHEQSASAGSGIGDAHRDEPVNTEPTTAESELSPSAVSVSDEIELPESVGRGNLAEETAAAIGLPAPEQQQETIRQLQHRASWQPPIKDDGTHIDEQDIVDVLVMGSGFCEGRFRIQEFFSATVLPTVKEQADWLKKEYGIGGRTWDFRDGERGFLDYDAKGLRIKRYASDNAPDHFRLLPWNEVARRLHLLVHNDKYLDENNKQGYEKWEAEQKAKRDARQAEIDYAEVYEYRYVTEASFDSYMWQLLETKQKFIGQIMTSKSPARSADDLDDAALSYAEVKALAAGNPMIKEKMDLDIQVSRLKTLKTAYNNEHYRLEDAITQGFPAEMRKTAQQLENAKADTALLQQNTKRDADDKDVFAISLMDTVYTKREDAGKALLGLLGMAMNRTEPVSIGRYKGFDLQIAYFAMDKMYLAYLVGSGINPVQLGADAVGNTVRLDNCLHNLPQSVTDLESKLVQLQKQLENAKEQLAQPFVQADELAEKSKRLAELEALLNLNEKDIVLDTVPDEEQQCRSDNRQRGQER